MEQETHSTSENLLSIVVPVYNESAVLPEFHSRLSHVLDSLPMASEIVYVDDGSTDDTPAILAKLRETDGRVAILTFSRNFGKEPALSAGIDYARGDAAVVIDADLQDPPELIPQMVEQWLSGYDVVSMRRISRKSDTLFKGLTARIFYRVLVRLSSIRIPENVGDYRLLSRRAVEAVMRFPERRRFMKGIFAWIGFRQTELPYDRVERRSGESKWKYRALWNLAIEGITSFSALPIKAVSCLGVVFVGLALLGAVITLARIFLAGAHPASLLVQMLFVMFLGGVQLIALGILGEYLDRIHTETQQRPLYVLKDYQPPREEFNAKTQRRKDL